MKKHQSVIAECVLSLVTESLFISVFFSLKIQYLAAHGSSQVRWSVACYPLTVFSVNSTLKTLMYTAISVSNKRLEVHITQHCILCVFPLRLFNFVFILYLYPVSIILFPLRLFHLFLYLTQHVPMFPYPSKKNNANMLSTCPTPTSLKSML